MNENRAFAVLVDDVLLNRIAVAHLSDIADRYDGSVDIFNRQTIQSLHSVGAAVDGDRVVARPDLGIARRQHQILRADGVGNVIRRKPMRVQRLRVNINVDDAPASAKGQGNLRPLHGRHLGADKVGAEVGQ